MAKTDGQIVFKTLVLIPAAVCAALGGAAGLCTLMGLAIHGRELLTAALVAVIAAEASVLPALMLRRGEPVILAQAALGGTVLHMMLTIFLAAALMVAKVVEPATPFVFWLTGAYWLSLAMLVWALIGLTPAKAK